MLAVKEPIAMMLMHWLSLLLTLQVYKFVHLRLSLEFYDVSFKDSILLNFQKVEVIWI